MANGVRKVALSLARIVSHRAGAVVPEPATIMEYLIGNRYLSASST